MCLIPARRVQVRLRIGALEAVEPQSRGRNRPERGERPREGPPSRRAFSAGERLSERSAGRHGFRPATGWGAYEKAWRCPGDCNRRRRRGSRGRSADHEGDASAPAPVNCFASIWTYLNSTAADCPLSWGPFTVYATLDGGFPTSSNGAPYNARWNNGVDSFHPKAELRREVALVAEQPQPVGRRHQDEPAASVLVGSVLVGLVAHRHLGMGIQSLLRVPRRGPASASEPKRQGVAPAGRGRRLRAAPASRTTRKRSSASATRPTAP